MLPALAHKLTVCGIAVAMLASSVAAMHPPGCDKCSPQHYLPLAGLIADAGASHASCCGSSSAAAERRNQSANRGRLPHDLSRLPRPLCCIEAGSTLPALPTSNVPRIAVDPGSYSMVSIAIDVKDALTSAACIATGPFWISASDGPSRQAVLCRFTT